MGFRARISANVTYQKGKPVIHENIRIQLTDILLEARKLSGDVSRHRIDIEMWCSQQGDEHADWMIEKDAELMPPFEAAIESLHWATICYLDALNLHVLLQSYLTGIGKNFNAGNKASSYEIRPDPYGGEYEPYNKYLIELERFLSPLGILAHESAYLRLAGIQYLETVLRNTAVITNKLTEKPSSETAVYKAVKDILYAIFSAAKKPSANFLKTAKEYKPDILIPQLAAAVEYKYADSEQKLVATIGQIADDVKGYSGDPAYKIFYAVFYVTQDFWGADKFKKVWEENKFPANWKAIYVVGA